jgi:hypothetical protein
MDRPRSISGSMDMLLAHRILIYSRRLFMRNPVAQKPRRHPAGLIARWICSPWRIHDSFESVLQARSPVR